MCVELLIGFRTHCSWSMQGLFFTFFHFYAIKRSRFSLRLLWFSKQIENISHPSTGRGVRKDGISLDQEKEQYQELKMMANSWKVEICCDLSFVLYYF